MAPQARAGVAGRHGATNACARETGERARGEPWRLQGLQSFARVVHIGLGQSSHGGDDERIFGAEVCPICIVLGLQLFACVVHIGLGQSSHRGDDERIF